jgi:aryl-alcohol dehydrogenase-like predicted oxidoreductase
MSATTGPERAFVLLQVLQPGPGGRARGPVPDTDHADRRVFRRGPRHTGLSEATPAQLEEAAAVHPVAAVQFEWSLRRSFAVPVTTRSSPARAD